MQMKQHPQDEYNRAFMGDDGAQPHEQADDGMAAEAITPDAPGDVIEGNSPTKDAAEGAGDTPAVAVVITGDEGDMDDVPAEDMQAFKSWRGRLKKREEAIAAREAALEGKGESDPAMLADGGKVDDEPPFVAGVAAPPEQSTNGQTAAAGDDADAILESFAEDYGPDFVAAIDKLIERRARAIVEEMGGAYVSDLSSRIDEVTQAAQENMGRMHGDVLMALREDAEEIANSHEFKAWIAGLEGDDKANAERVVESGNLREVLGLFKQYDGAKGGEERSTEDVWAEDAATGVKGSAPIKLPTRAPASPDDEYKRAWEAM